MFLTLFKKAAENISPQEARRQLKKDKTIVLLDVRSGEEFYEKRIPGSKNLPLDRIREAEKIIPNKETALYVYCFSGSRATAACKQLSKMGYTHLYNLGGIQKWPYDTVRGKE